MDFKNSCRVCRDNLEDHSYALSSKYDGLRLSEILAKITNVNFNFDYNSNLSKKICYICLELTQSARKLQKIALESDEYFREEIRKFEASSNTTYSTEDVFVKQEFDIGNIKTEITDFLEQYQENERENSDDIPLKTRATKRKYVRKERTEEKQSSLEFACDHCGVTASTKYEMENHMLVLHAWSEKELYRKLNPEEIKANLKCCKCKKNHENVGQLMEHINVHAKGFKKFECRFCKERPKTFANFTFHSIYHAQPPTHKCLSHRCRRDFIFDRTFLAHIRTHIRYEENKVFCLKCGLKVRNDRELEIHDRVKHKKEMLFICPNCAKSFCSSNSLDKHIRQVHNKAEARKFECKICHMKFVEKATLARHEATHSTERPFKCDKCTMDFKQAHALKVHVRRHDGPLARKFFCTQCSHGFLSNYNLQKHMLSHTGEKPHQCSYCDRAYASKGDLNKHLQTHVGNSIYTCEFCQKGFRMMVELREHQREHAT